MPKKTKSSSIITDSNTGTQTIDDNDSDISIDRQKMIEVAAYYIAEKRNFEGGNPEEDWFEAELEIDDLINESNEND